MGSLANALSKVGGSSADALRNRNEELKNQGETPKAEDAKKEPVKREPVKTAKAAKKPVKAVKREKEKKVKTTKTKRTPVKGTKPTKKTTRRNSRPTLIKKAEGRTADRDRTGDGLRPIERKMLKALEKAGGELSIINLAAKVFNKTADEIPAEGIDSIRTIRNAVRRPITYGMMKWNKRGVVAITPAFQKAGFGMGSVAVKRAATEKAKTPKAKKSAKAKSKKGK